MILLMGLFDDSLLWREWMCSSPFNQTPSFRLATGGSGGNSVGAQGFTWRSCANAAEVIVKNSPVQAISLSTLFSKVDLIFIKFGVVLCMGIRSALYQPLIGLG